MRIRSCPVEGVYLVEPTVRQDSRGFFLRGYCESELHPILGSRHVVQLNLSTTTEIGTIRGLHLQNAPHAETKLVRCVKGRIWDVAVDLRPQSPTYRSWFAEELTEFNHLMLVIPEGCAHGFQCLEAGSTALYCNTAAYAPESERGYRFDDASLSIAWPLPPANVSEKDRNWPLLKG